MHRSGAATGSMTQAIRARFIKALICRFGEFQDSH